MLALTVSLGCLLATGAAPASASACPNESMRYGYGAYLPDCRAYEQATPVDKDGTNPQLSWNAVQAADDGGGITFFTQAGVPGGTGATQLPSFLSTRGAGGWSTQGLLPAGKDNQPVSSVVGWTPDLSEVLDKETIQEPSSVPFTIRNTLNDSVQTVATLKGATYSFVGASSDDSKVFFEVTSGPQLTPEAVAGEDNLYVWDRSTGVIELVGVLPASACGSPPCTPAGGSFGGAYDWWVGNLTSGGGKARFYTQAQHVISSDGEKAYFTAGGTGQLYIRERAASAGAATVQVSASQKTNGAGPGGVDANGPQPAAFMMAAPDGSQAFFTSPEELTNDATTGTVDQGNDLYRYEAVSGALTDLAPDSTDPNGAEVKGVLGVADNGSYVYFVANGDLDGAGPAATGNCAVNDFGEGFGECSLYLWHGGKVMFVARLDAAGRSEDESDAADWMPGAGFSISFNMSWVSADGHVLLFRSQRRLTAYENDGVPEFYRYDTQSGLLGCVSCNPSGIPPSTSGGPRIQTETSFFSLAGFAKIETRNLSASGDQFFFETSDPLLPADSNGVSDVYEWEADGAGSCESSADEGGCLYLLSTGSSPDASHLGDASASGDDVFLFTDQPLVGQDQDQLIDIYDARVGGGLASQDPLAVPPCNGDECRSPLAAPPASPFAASTTLVGQGNQTPAKAPSAKAGTIRRTLKKTVRSGGFLLKVSARANGRIAISGPGVIAVSRSVPGAGSYRLRVQLTAREKRLLVRRHSLRLTLRVVYTPAAAASVRSGK